MAWVDKPWRIFHDVTDNNRRVEKPNALADAARQGERMVPIFFLTLHFSAL